MEFNNLSYNKHKSHYQETFDEEKLKSWANKKTVDYWRHERMYKNLDPLINSYPDAKWLTIGDGRYGTDANYLSSKGIQDVLATDISDTYLKEAVQTGFINKYKIENAENLTFDDGEFDFTLCKEAYHHFPRPMVALYEMIRVSKQGVILIEPNDSNILTPSKFNWNAIFKHGKQVIKDMIKSKIGRKKYYDFGNYEDVGNYVYTTSEREIEKVALGLNFDMVSFKGMNDSYLDGVEFEEVHASSELLHKIRKNIREADRRSNSGLNVPGLLVSIIFKQTPSEKCINLLNEQGFRCVELSKNPFIGGN